MDQSDIKYILDMLNDAIASKDWDIVEEARDEMRDEYLDAVSPPNDEETT